MSRRGTSSGGGASSLGYLFGSDATPLVRPNNRAPPRHPQPASAADDALTTQQQYSGYNPPRSRQQQSEYAGDPPTSGYDTPTSGYETPTGYHTPSGYDTSSGPPRPDHHSLPSHMPSPAMLESNYRTSPMHHHNQTRAAGKVINDGGGMSLDMSGGSMGRNNNYFRADGQNSGNFITDRPSTRVQAAPGGGSSLGYLFGGA